MTNVWFSTAVSLLVGLVLCFGGYLNIWPLFGASNQLLGGMTMITLAVFCKVTGRKGWMLYVPVAFLLCCTFTSLAMSIASCWTAVATYGLFGTIPATATTAAAPVLLTKGLQLVVAVLLVVLGVIVGPAPWQTRIPSGPSSAARTSRPPRPRPLPPTQRSPRPRRSTRATHRVRIHARTYIYVRREEPTST